MNQYDVEPAADVRAFLPRPGEPVEEYASRLRALHRDLTLVLQAVERGLSPGPAAAVRDPEPPPAREPLPGPVTDVVPVSTLEPEPIGDAAARAPASPPGMPRVEVLPARTRRGGDDPASTPWAAEADRPHEPYGRRSTDLPATAGAAPPESPPVEEPPAAPSAAQVAVVAAPAAPPPEPAAPADPPGRGMALPPWAIAAVLAGWLTIVALLLAVLLDA
jgi:hypothetical protein